MCELGKGRAVRTLDRGARLLGGLLVAAGNRFLDSHEETGTPSSHTPGPGVTEVPRPATQQAVSVFESERYSAINVARLEHLNSLDLPIAGRSVLEVGAGIGVLGEFFEALGCDLVSTDGRPENVAEMRRLYPRRNTAVWDLRDSQSAVHLAVFDIVFCYGFLYHTPEPEVILERLAGHCRHLMLLETCVTPGTHFAVHLTRESNSVDQALGGVGCRPTRPWIMDRLRRFFGHAYSTKTQPRHEDFDLDWDIPVKKLNHRAVFVASRTPMVNPLLVAGLPRRHGPVAA